MGLKIKKMFIKSRQTEIKDEIHPNQLALVNLLSQGQSSSKAQEIINEIASFKFENMLLENELQWLYFYFKVENYLIIKDGKYIGTPQKLRNSLIENSETFKNSSAFNTLLGTAESQQISITQYFIKYFIHKYDENAKTNQSLTRWGYTKLLSTETQKNIDKVTFIHTNRKLKDAFLEIYTEAVTMLEKSDVDPIFENTISTFTKNFHGIKSLLFLKDLFPTSTTTIKSLPKAFNTTNPTVTIEKPVKLEPIPTITPSNSIANATILENILDGYLLIDRSGKILDFNSNARKIFVYPENIFKHMKVRDLFPASFIAELNNDLDLTNNTYKYQIIGKRNEIEFEIKNEVKDFEVTVTNNYSSPTDTFTIFLKDFSHKKETIQNIRDAKVNAERTAQAKSTFLSNMSHEIRTPLNVILGLSGIIKDNDINDPEIINKNLQGIDFSARNLLAIVNDILDFSKIEAGKLTIQSLDFNLKKVVESISSGFNIKAQEKGLRYNFNFNDDIPNIIIGDQYRLNQVLTNLIGNAIKFTKDGQVSLGIRTVTETDNNVTIEFKVSDTGIGIDEEQLKHIFDSFYQIEKPESSKIQGTGLGLAITKQLIELLGGKLQAYSTVSKGSTFVFDINFAKSSLKDIRVQQKTLKHQDEKLEGLKVLVAEDNRMNQFYIKQLLNNLKIEVVIVENGQEAVDAYLDDNQSFDLILMDMHMPLMNGIEAIKQIRSTPKNKLNKVPIVICSADVFPEARKNAIKAGIDFYLTKPLSLDALKEVLYWLVNDAFSNKVTKEFEDGTQSKSIDIEHLLKTFDNDQEFVASLLEVFITETPADYNTLRDCITKGYNPRVKEIAHKLKSSFMNLGMTSHGHHLQQIEKNILSTENKAVALNHFEKFKKLYSKTLLEVNLLLLDLKKNQPVEV